MFYDSFVELCRQRGVKPSRVAEECGIGRSNVAGWKSKGYTPRGEALQKLAAYFGVPVDRLLGKEAPAPARAATREELLFALFGGSEDITDEMYEDVKRYARFVKEKYGK